MRSGLLLTLLVAAMLAGCVDGNDPAVDDGVLGRFDAVGSDGLTEPSNNTTLPTLGPPLDPWAGNVTELILFEGAVEARVVNEWTCFALATTGGNAPPCFATVPTDGPFVPLGTAALRVEADAGQALKAGSWLAALRTPVREALPDAFGEETREAAHAWTFPLVAHEWDAPWWDRSVSILDFRPSLDGVLDGAIQVKVFAERELSWEPIPQYDHFRIPALHGIPQAGVITLLDANATVTEPASGTPGTAYDLPPFTELVPAGTTRIVVGVAWERVEGCGSTDQCYLRVHGFWAGGSVAPWREAVQDSGPNHFIRVLAVPDVFRADQPAADTSLTTFANYPFCSRPVAGPEVGCVTGVTADYHVLVEAWEKEPDLEAFRQRLGIAS